MNTQKKANELKEQFGTKAALFAAKMIEEYETKICAKCYDYDYEMFYHRLIYWKEVLLLINQ